MNVSEIKKYHNKSVPALLKLAVKHFNAFIRKRDEGQPCINCGKFTNLQAGHYFPSTISSVRFDEDNVNGECISCNYFNSQSHSYKYRVNLIKKIGEDRFKKLEEKAAMRTGHKWDRFTLISLIETYKNKV